MEQITGGSSLSSSLLSTALRRLSKRIVPLVRTDVVTALVLEVERHFGEQLLPELHDRVGAILSRELSERVEALIDRALPACLDAILGRELPERVEAIIGGMLPACLNVILDRELPERAEAIIDRAVLSRELQLYRPNNIVAGSIAGPYMAASNSLARDFLHPEYREFCRLYNIPVLVHRKFWEWAFIYDRLRKMGVLRAEMRGLGFGVGGERLPSLFASLGTYITATDAPAEVAWQLNSKDHLFCADVVTRKYFDERVSFEFCDMNDIPRHLSDYDFCWSSCALEHLGSLQQGIDFVINSIERTLKVGGIACHTTELNLTSDDETIETGVTVLYRKRDLERLCQLLEERGHWVEPLRIEPGTLPPDYFVDVPPYRPDPHLKLLIGSYIATSVGIVARRGK